MVKNYLKNFIIYLSDYFFAVLFLLTSLSIFYFFLFDTSFLASYGVFENELLLGIVSAAASIEITALFFVYYYFKLKKKYYFAHINRRKINLQNVLRFIGLRFISFFIRIISFLVFFSPFSLSLSSIALLSENGVSQKVFFILSVGSVLLLITSLFSYSVFIQKISFFEYLFLKHPYLSFRKLIKQTTLTADGNLFALFRFKVRNIPKKMASLLIIPAIYYLPSCLYDFYDCLCQKENPYPHKVNTEKTVVFYFDPIKES